MSPIYIEECLSRNSIPLHQAAPLYVMGEILHTLRKTSPIYYRRKFAYPTQNVSHILQEKFCILYAKRLLYITGEILRTLRKTSPI